MMNVTKTCHTTYLINKGTQQNIEVGILGIVALRIMTKCLNRQQCHLIQQNII